MDTTKFFSLMVCACNCAKRWLTFSLSRLRKIPPQKSSRNHCPRTFGEAHLCGFLFTCFFFLSVKCAGSKPYALIGKHIFASNPMCVYTYIYIYIYYFFLFLNQYYDPPWPTSFDRDPESLEIKALVIFSHVFEADDQHPYVHILHICCLKMMITALVLLYVLLDMISRSLCMFLYGSFSSVQLPNLRLRA